MKRFRETDRASRPLGWVLARCLEIPPDACARHKMMKKMYDAIDTLAHARDMDMDIPLDTISHMVCEVTYPRCYPYQTVKQIFHENMKNDLSKEGYAFLCTFVLPPIADYLSKVCKERQKEMWEDTDENDDRMLRDTTDLVSVAMQGVMFEWLNDLAQKLMEFIQKDVDAVEPRANEDTRESVTIENVLQLLKDKAGLPAFYLNIA